MKSLNEIYREGNAEIWYKTKESWENDPMGGLKAPDFKIAELPETHRLLGRIDETDLEKIFHDMQGEVWSPNGEARSLIRAKGLVHTSMSIGDVVKIGNKAWAVDGCGFKELKNSPDVEVQKLLDDITDIKRNP